MSASRPLFFAAILFLVVSTLRSFCHDLCCSICRLDRQHHSSSDVFPSAASVTPLTSAHIFLWEGQLQYHYLELFLASSSVLFKYNGLWYFNILVNQQLNNFKKANQVQQSWVHFMQNPFPADRHISHTVRIASPKMLHCACLLFLPLSIFIFYLPSSPSWLAFNYCFTIFGTWLLAGVHTPLLSWAQVPHSHFFYFYSPPDHLLLEGDTTVRWPPFKDSGLWRTLLVLFVSVNKLLKSPL